MICILLSEISVQKRSVAYTGAFVQYFSIAQSRNINFITIMLLKRAKYDTIMIGCIDMFHIEMFT